MLLFSTIVPACILLFTFWGTWTLPLPRIGRFLIFCLLSAGFLYAIPFGPRYDLGSQIPLWQAQIAGTMTAITITFVALLFARLLVVLLLSLCTFYAFALRILNIRQDDGYSCQDVCLVWHARRRTIFCSARLSTFLLIGAILLGGYGGYEALRVPRVIHHEIAVENLPEALDGYTIVQISDTHLGVVFREEWMQAVVDKIKGIDANLIVHTGDIADADAHDILDILAPLKELNAPDGVFYTFGNHENIHSHQGFVDYYDENNFKYMEDEAILLNSVPLELSIAYAARRATPTNFEKIFNGVSKQEAHENGIFRLHLDHFPARAPEAAEYVDLQLSGHTHGGLTFFIAPIIAAANRGYVNGLYEVPSPSYLASLKNTKNPDSENKHTTSAPPEKDSMLLYVSSTTGLWSYVPIRIGNPSEIAVLTLVCAKTAD